MVLVIRKREGFTLVELLIVVAIIGILATIAIPSMWLYRTRAYCASMETDLTNWAKAEEAYFVDNQAYLLSGDPAVIPGFKATTGVTVTAVTADTQSFVGTATHASCVNAAGGQRTYTFDSTQGGITKDAP